jgi:hypothetical protein
VAAAAASSGPIAFAKPLSAARAVAALYPVVSICPPVRSNADPISE